jgi:hypothetical protein
MILPPRLVETTPALGIADLLTALQMRQPEAWARWSGGGGPALFGPERLPLSCGGDVIGQVVASASLDGTRGAVRLAREAQGRTKAQIIELRAIPSPSGLRWLWKCPVSELLCLRLYLPQGAVGFAGRQAHALRYRSETLTMTDRAVQAANTAKALRRSLGQEPPELGGPPPPPPPRMSARRYLLKLSAIRRAEGEMRREAATA